MSVGIRVNPECSTQEGEHAIYDPCAYGSRLGVTLANFPEDLPPEIEGLHFHTLCEQNADDLLTTWKAFEAKFSKYFKQLKWLNLGGGHHITRSDYDVEALIDLVKYIRNTYHVEVYLEPGEAVALNAGYLVTEVLDIVHNGLDILILDASAACHMPDVLEMPYRPPLRGGYEADEKQYKYRLSSMTCLAGDVIGDYSFDKEIKVGDKLILRIWRFIPWLKIIPLTAFRCLILCCCTRAVLQSWCAVSVMKILKDVCHDVRERLYSRCRRLSHARRIRTA